MKQLILLLCLYLLSTTLFAENKLTIFKRNPNYAMTLHYQICPLNQSETDCDTPHEVHLAKDQSYADIAVNDAFYIVVNNASEYDAENKVVATGNFIYRSCSVYTYHPTVLDDVGSDRIVCMPA